MTEKPITETEKPKERRENTRDQWDRGERGVKGLHLRTSKDGRRSWMLYYRTKTGIQRRPKIGDEAFMTLGKAREVARTMLAKVELGGDPAEEARRNRAEARQSKHLDFAVPTLRHLYQETYAGHWNTPRYRESGRLTAVERLWSGTIEPYFGHLPYIQITATAVNNWKLKHAETPYQLNRAKEVLNFIFNWCERFRLIPRGTNPCPNVDPYPEKSRTRYATPEELKSVWTELAKEEELNPLRVAFIKLLLLTGSRPMALQKARREQLQVIIREGKRHGLLTSPGKSTAKTGEDEMVVFPPEAMTIVDSLPIDPDGLLIGCLYPRKLWERIREKSGIKDLRARDLRRTFATFGLSGGVSLSSIGELLNHSNTNTTRIYAKLLPTARMKAAAQVAENITAILHES